VLEEFTRPDKRRRTGSAAAVGMAGLLAFRTPQDKGMIAHYHLTRNP
jgi:hypothetical protein